MAAKAHNTHTDPDMAAKAHNTHIEDDWQLNRSIIDCNRHMLENGIATDVTFLVYGKSTLLH